jgi:uncharacterized surface protein with fasciclin (FAS1) repeats
MTTKMAVAMLAVTMASPAVAGDKGTMRAGKDIVETAVAAGSFKTLAKALEAAGLVDTLKGEGPFTVFAPTDEAFAKLPPGALDALVADKEKLRSVLLYHVVPGNVTASEIVKLQSAKTASGDTLAIDAREGVKVGAASVVKADVMARNGVIHVIDSVMLPGDGRSAMR